MGKLIACHSCLILSDVPIKKNYWMDKSMPNFAGLVEAVKLLIWGTSISAAGETHPLKRLQLQGCTWVPIYFFQTCLPSCWFPRANLTCVCDTVLLLWGVIILQFAAGAKLYDLLLSKKDNRRNSWWVWVVWLTRLDTKKLSQWADPMSPIWCLVSLAFLFSQVCLTMRKIRSKVQA